jgi:pimeloyl-ACP methyl ester carboxylesterase
VTTVVSRGGRVDLAKGYLKKVACPVLCIVGGRDLQVLEMNRQALKNINSKAEIKIVEGAGHLFEESDALEQVAELTKDWFRNYLFNQNESK